MENETTPKQPAGHCKGLSVSGGSDSTSEENVVEFHSSLPPLETSKRQWVFCERRCTQLVLDEHTRTVKCRDCGKVIDPFDWLYRKAVEKENRMGSLRSIDAEIRKKRIELMQLKIDVKNAKAQLRRATEPLFEKNKGT